MFKDLDAIWDNKNLSMNSKSMKVAVRLQNFVLRDLGINGSNMKVSSTIYAVIKTIKWPDSLIKMIKFIASVESLAMMVGLISIFQTLSYF